MDYFLMSIGNNLRIISSLGCMPYSHISNTSAQLAFFTCCSPCHLAEAARTSARMGLLYLDSSQISIAISGRNGLGRWKLSMVYKKTGFFLSAGISYAI